MTNNNKQQAIRLIANLSTETLQARKEWQDILKVMKGKNLQSRLLYPARISFRFEGEIKSPQARGTGTLILSVRRLVWAGKHQLGNAAWGASFPSERALPAGGFGSVHTPSP